MKKIIVAIGLAVSVFCAKAQTYVDAVVSFTTNSGLAGGYSSNNVPPAVGATAGTLFPTNAQGQPFIFALGTPNKYREITIQVQAQVVTNSAFQTVANNTSNLVSCWGVNLDGNPTNFATNFFRLTNSVGTNQLTFNTAIFPTNTLGTGYLILDHFENFCTNVVQVGVQIGAKPGF